jgi:hypothetical protein
MIRFYLNNKQLILNTILLFALILAFVFPAESFVRSSCFGAATGIAIVNFGNEISKAKKVRDDIN